MKGEVNVGFNNRIVWWAKRGENENIWRQEGLIWEQQEYEHGHQVNSLGVVREDLSELSPKANCLASRPMTKLWEMYYPFMILNSEFSQNINTTVWICTKQVFSAWGRGIKNENHYCYDSDKQYKVTIGWGELKIQRNELKILFGKVKIWHCAGGN